jgi:uncharacterized protein (TIGR02246 family)
MTSPTQGAPASGEKDEAAITALYHKLLDCWNRREAGEFAALYAEDGSQVGFDGSQIEGRAEIETHLRQIFTDHVTAAYVGKVREVRFLSAQSALLRAVVGMVPPGKSDINPATNAIQSLIAVKQGGEWRIAHYQNTPAQFHGRPEAVAALTNELRELL